MKNHEQKQKKRIMFALIEEKCSFLGDRLGMHIFWTPSPPPPPRRIMDIHEIVIRPSGTPAKETAV